VGASIRSRASVRPSGSARGGTSRGILLIATAIKFVWRCYVNSHDVHFELDPGGIVATSQGLSAATSPVRRAKRAFDPGGVAAPILAQAASDFKAERQSDAAGIPPGCSLTFNSQPGISLRSIPG